MRRRTQTTSTQAGLLGPGLTTRQLTALVVAVVLAVVLVPVGAQAAQVVSAIITDPGGTNKATVDAGGNLHVAGGVSVDGTVGARIALAANHLQDTTFLIPGLQDQATLFGPADVGEKVAITSLTFTNYGTKVGQLEIDVITNIGDPPDCDAGGGVGHNTLQQISVPIGDSVEFSYPEPLVATSGFAPWCLVADRIFGDDIRLTMVGFKA
jgi:hypothetical protein